MNPNDLVITGQIIRYNGTQGCTFKVFKYELTNSLVVSVYSLSDQELYEEKWTDETKLFDYLMSLRNC